MKMKRQDFMVENELNPTMMPASCARSSRVIIYREEKRKDT
jgi:hypothetical protein